jgi:hypothetical protein
MIAFASVHVKRFQLLLCIVAGLLPSVPVAAQDLPQGYLVWSKGTAGDPATRRLYRMTLPATDDVRPLTEGEDVEPRISPDGQWIAYAKAKFPGGTDYHDFRLWKPYIVSIHGAGGGRTEIKIDDDGAWPSWSASGALFYDQSVGTHTHIIRAELDAQGRVTSKQIWLSTQDQFPQYSEVNECFVSPDETWFAARTRGNADQNGVGAFSLSPPGASELAHAGSIGCMPFVAPKGVFAVIAGAGQGIRWGQSPFVAARTTDQLLIAALSPDHLAYHPGISTDEKWVLAAQGVDTDHNAGRYDLYIHTLDAEHMIAGAPRALTADGFNGWPHLWVGTPTPPPAPKPMVAGFVASSYTVSPGEAVTLTWTTNDADVVTLDGTPVSSNGTLVVQPPVTTNYVLVAGSSAVATTDTRSITITVNPVPLPATIDAFTATPTKVEKGSSSVLAWQVSNATTLTLDGQVVAPIGSREVVPLATTTYTLVAQGQAGPASAQVTIEVGAIATGLLPERGGFVCGIAGPRGRASLAGAVLIVGLAVLVRRLRKRR